MAHGHHSSEHRPTGVHSGVLIIPAALAVFTALAVLLTIRTVGFAIVAGIVVFAVTFVLTLLLHRFLGDAPRDR